MKNMILIIALIYSVAFGQSWNSTVTTTINTASLERMDLFTNKDGNHLLIKNSNGNIIYYNINSQGTVDNNKTETLESNGDYPTITGSNDKIYAIYKSGNYIKGKYSINGGTDWTPLSNINVGSNACNGIDAAYQNQIGVHVVYAMRDSDPYFETYYYLLNTNNAWVNYKQVTDYGTEVGGVPSVNFSSNRVHVSYNSGEATPPYIGVGVSKSRDKIGNDWQTPQLVSDGEVDFGTSREKLQVRGNKLFCIFYDAWVDLGQYGWRIQVKSRDLAGAYWPSEYNNIFYNGHPQSLLGAETTANGNLHVLNYNLGVVYRSYNGSQWSDQFEVSSDYLNYEMQHYSFSSASNDLFVVWKPENDNYLKYRQYDAAPLAPQNPQLSANPGNNKIRISWTKNNEPDISLYEVWRKVAELGGVWQNIGTTTNTYLVDNEFLYAPGAGDFTITYKVRAKDIGNKYSDFSVGVTTRGEYMGKDVTEVNMKEFRLNDNYPNPFNPSTKISWQSPVSGWQTLKVYDVLGNEVATLVDEYREAGRYEVEFNAVETRRGVSLSSGIYFYRLSAGSFTEVKKMILSK